MRNIKFISLIFTMAAALMSSCLKQNEYVPPVNTAPIPKIIKLSPENISPGELLTIKGLNFSPDPAKNVIRLNDQIIEPVSTSDSAIQIKIPDLDEKRVWVSVRSNEKISNRTILSLIQTITYKDDFNRPNVGWTENNSVPNLLGENWKIIMGGLILENGKLATHNGGVQAYMLYKEPGAEMKVGDNHLFQFSTDLSISAGSFAGVIFNVQEDNKKFYLLRMNGKLVQLLKTGNNGLDDWAAIMINAEFEGLGNDINYRVTISSASPGKINIKVADIATSVVLLNQSAEDNQPYVGGAAGYYYFALANPTNIYFDNFLLELQ